MNPGHLQKTGARKLLLIPIYLLLLLLLLSPWLCFPYMAMSAGAHAGPPRSGNSRSSVSLTVVLAHCFTGRKGRRSLLSYIAISVCPSPRTSRRLSAYSASPATAAAPARHRQQPSSSASSSSLQDHKSADACSGYARQCLWMDVRAAGTVFFGAAEAFFCFFFFGTRSSCQPHRTC